MVNQHRNCAELSPGAFSVFARRKIKYAYDKPISPIALLHHIWVTFLMNPRNCTVRSDFSTRFRGCTPCDGSGPTFMQSFHTKFSNKKVELSAIKETFCENFHDGLFWGTLLFWTRTRLRRSSQSARPKCKRDHSFADRLDCTFPQSLHNRLRKPR